MKILPPGNSHLYQGGRFAPGLMLVLSLLTLGPGMIHAFLPDGGMGVIAGLDLTHHREVIVGLAGWTGAVQIVWGLVLLAAALCYRAFIAPLLMLIFLERSIILLNMTLLKPVADGHHPPEFYGSWVMLAILPFGIWDALRKAKV